MKRILFSLAALALALPLSAQSTKGVTLPPFEQFTLSNGLRVILMEKHDVPLIAFNARIRGGGLVDPAGKAGTSDLVAELIQKGAGKRNAQQFAEALDNVGGTLDASTGREAMIVNGEFLSKDRALMLELISDMLRRPLLPREEFDKVKTREIQSLKAAKDSDPRQLVPLYFDAFIYASHPYGRSADETSLAGITHEDVTQYVAEQFGADRAVFAFVGDFDSKSLAADVKRVFGDWKKASATLPQVNAAPAVKGRRVLLIDKPDATQTYFEIGNIGVARNDPDRVVLDVANTAFGGRFTSMLNTELRIKSGLSYGARSNIGRYTTPGTVKIASYTKTESTEKAIDLALDVLNRLRTNGLDDATLKSVQAYNIGQFPPTLETGGQLATKLTELAFFGLDKSDVESLASKIMATDRAALTRVIGRVYPDPQNLTFVMIGNAAKIRDVAKKYGTVTEMKITDPRFTP